MTERRYNIYGRSTTDPVPRCPCRKICKCRGLEKPLEAPIVKYKKDGQKFYVTLSGYIEKKFLRELRKSMDVKQK